MSSNNQIPDLVKKGLTEEEAKLLSNWIEDGKPGLAKYKAERLGEIYCLGYSCEDIKRWFPEYPIEVLLWAKISYNWDDTRAQYRKVVQQETLNAALSARMESIRFLADVITATHVKYRKEILNFIADPDKNEAPKKIIPDNIHSYGYLISMLKEITSPVQDKNLTDKSTPLVSVTVNNQDKPEIVLTQNGADDIKKALMAEADKK
jgi:hypothetical protein